MNWSDVLKAVIPVLVAALAWLLGQVNSFSERLTKIEGAMPALITDQGVPTDSPHRCRETKCDEGRDIRGHPRTSGSCQTS